jgi:hypothetical protein
MDSQGKMCLEKQIQVGILVGLRPYPRKEYLDEYFKRTQIQIEIEK